MTPEFMVWSTRRTKKPLNPPNQPLCATHTRFKKELYFSFSRQMPEISLLNSHSSWISFSLSRQLVSKWKYPLERFFNVDGFILATQRHPWNHLVQASYFIWKKQRSKEVNDLAQGRKLESSRDLKRRTPAFIAHCFLLCLLSRLCMGLLAMCALWGDTGRRASDSFTILCGPVLSRTQEHLPSRLRIFLSH